MPCHFIAGQTILRERVIIWQYSDDEDQKFKAWTSFTEHLIRAILDVRVLQQKQLITSMYHHVQVNGKKAMPFCMWNLNILIINNTCGKVQHNVIIIYRSDQKQR